MEYHYLDNGSSRPVYPEVLEAMTPYFLERHGNPSSVHQMGREANADLEEARDAIKKTIGGENGRLVFTSGATEANNLAILGLAAKFLKKVNKSDTGKTRLVTTQIEHISVYNAFRFLEKQGFQVSYLPVDEFGIIDLEALKTELTEDTALVSVMYANQEMGSIQPVSEIAKLAAEKGAIFHSDAAAALGRLEIDVEETGIDMISLGSNDVYGPPGIGALYYRQGLAFDPLFHGGGQEFRKRPGTEALPLVAGFRRALDITMCRREDEMRRLRELQEVLMERLTTEIPECYLNGHPTKRLFDNVNVRFSFIEGEAMLLHLENQGIMAATGSACTSDSLQASRVLTSMGVPHELAHGSLQITLGKDTTEEDVEHLLDVLPPIIEQLRMMSPLTPDDFFD